ncbi:hypothetical protein KKB18_13570 [bacterium]|nr:hypothetical protein [bacterium]
MRNIINGIIAGLIFGIIDILLMIPLPLTDKATAMAGAFAGRFAIGFFIFVSDLKTSGWIKGVIVGLLLSVPDAIITKTYVPILGIGILGGALIGLISDKAQA